MNGSKRLFLFFSLVVGACSSSSNGGGPAADASTADVRPDASGGDAASDSGAADGAGGDAGAADANGEAADASAGEGGDAGAQSGDGGGRGGADDGGDGGSTSQLLPTGDIITPTAAPVSTLAAFNPQLPGLPNFRADHATSSVTSPDGNTLLVLTSGYNMTVYTPASDAGATGNEVPGQSGEWVFVYDISGNGAPVQKQILTLPNSFAGIAFNPSGTEFYVAGGQDDNVHVFDRSGTTWAETMVTTDAGTAPAIALGHAATSKLTLGGLGFKNGPVSAGIGVTQDGSRLVVANYEDDSVSVVDVATRAATELDLRPGKAAASPEAGVAGGEYPFWVVVKGNSTAYVTSQRDREVDVVAFAADAGAPIVSQRIKIGGQPNKMILNKDQSRLFVLNGNSDSVTIIDTATNAVLETISVLAPAGMIANTAALKGANPNGLALSPDEKTLYVTDGATNAVAVVRRDPALATGAHTIGLIPTGWYPTSVSTSADGSHLYVTNAKSVPGPACLDILHPSWGPLGTPDAGGSTTDQRCWNGNQYVWQLETAGLLSLPTPAAATLATLTAQVAANDHFAATTTADATMAFLQTHIQHVIYVIKENRTYDQVLGDLGTGNGDPSLTMFPQSVTPNLHALASQFVDLDEFLDTGETSGVGWNWTVAAHATDAIERNQPVNYGKGGTTYDWEGTNRNVNVGIPTVAGRVAANPSNPTDPDLLPGAVDVSAPDPGDANAAGSGYLWDTVLRAGKTIRNYGAFLDLARYQSVPGAPSTFLIPLDPSPFAAGIVQAFPANATLAPNTDPYFRGFDQNYPDHWRYQEWKREFDGFVTGSSLPALEIVRLAHDHTGSYGTALAGVTTPVLQVADNDYAVGELVAAVAASPYANNTLVFIVEDDAQDGPDHVDAHRSTAYVAGPYVKRGAVVSTHYNTISLVKTIEQVLHVEPLGLYDALAVPMSDVFDTTLAPSFAFQATASDLLAVGTTLLPPQTDARFDPATRRELLAELRRTHDASYWARAMKGQNFAREDAVDVAPFNRALWKGIKGAAPFPAPPARSRVLGRRR